MYDEDAGFHTFENPASGAVHILKSNPRQRTLGYPRRKDAVAEAYCGYILRILWGDLEPHRDPIDAAERPQVCRTCAESAPAFYVYDSSYGENHA